MKMSVRVLWHQMKGIKINYRGQYLVSGNFCSCIVAPDKREEKEGRERILVSSNVFFFLFITLVPFSGYPRTKLKAKERRMRRRNSDNAGKRNGEVEKLESSRKVGIWEKLPKFQLSPLFSSFFVNQPFLRNNLTRRPV